MKYWECIDIPGVMDIESIDVHEEDTNIVDDESYDSDPTTEQCENVNISDTQPVEESFVSAANGVEAGAAIIDDLFAYHAAVAGNGSVPPGVFNVSLTTPQSNSGLVYDQSANKVSITEERAYTLDDNKMEKIIDKLYEYQDKYFKEIPIKHISNQFLRNITKEMYDAHLDAVDKFEAPALMDPIILLYPFFTDDPYMSMGKFWDILMTKIIDVDNTEWRDAIDSSVSDYEDYVEKFYDNDEDEEDIGENNSDVAEGSIE